MTEKCPTCQRPFEKMMDFPLVLIRKVEILPIPEVIDEWSEEAIRARTTQGLPQGGINRTPEIAAAYSSEVVQNYFRGLKGQEGREVSPSQLLPSLEPDKYFKWAYPVPGSRLYLALSEAESQGIERVCNVTLHAQGPNLGSAGGPTLQEFGAVAIIHYQGHLVGDKSEHEAL